LRAIFFVNVLFLNNNKKSHFLFENFLDCEIKILSFHKSILDFRKTMPADMRNFFLNSFFPKNDIVLNFFKILIRFKFLSKVDIKWKTKNGKNKTYTPSNCKNVLKITNLFFSGNILKIYHKSWIYF